MKRLFVELLVVGILLAGADAADRQEFRWLLEEPLQEEFLPLFEADIVGPDERTRALECYHKGDFRTASLILERIAELQLPDGDLGFVRFALAETYRMLGLEDKSIEQYHKVIEQDPRGNKVAPSLYRLIESACKRRDGAEADSLFTVFHMLNKGHPLYSSVLYEIGKLYYREGRYGEGYQLLSQIPESSSRHVQSRFLAALCHCELKEWDKALLLLQYVRDKATDPLYRDEAAVVIGDIYYLRDNIDAALQFYSAVPSGAPRYFSVLVKIAQANLDAGRFDVARDLARNFVQKYPDNEYFFEMASVLEQSYKKLGDDDQALKINNDIFQQLTNTRLTFELYDEIDRVVEMKKSWQLIDFEAIRSENSQLRGVVHGNVQRLDALKSALIRELARLGGNPDERDMVVVKGRLERRYLKMIRDSVAAYEDSLQDVNGRLKLLAFRQAETPDDTLVMNLTVSLDNERQRLDSRRAAYEHEIGLVIAQCLDQTNHDPGNNDVDRQTQFVDWSFMHYIDKRNNFQTSGTGKAANGTEQQDSLERKGKEVLQLFAAIDRRKRSEMLKMDRERLIEHIETLLDIYPNSIYNASLNFRLAELYYDKASDDFDSRLKSYEKQMAGGTADTVSFPEYNLDKVISLYDRIAIHYPKSTVADDALFYRALAMQKTGHDEEANRTLITLTEKYPESEYYVEANMKIGRFYFDHPKIDGGKGYDLAEAAFRKVLYYRDHPQFVQALYQLGWCYYMKDMYEKAIAVFKYLVEEVHLDFDPTRMEENQVVNPLLREEAIDYIAISFDEEGRMNDAMNFLKLIGNADYAAMVLKRVGELRVEDLDYRGAIEIYKKLINEYPSSIVAPDASVALMKVYESMNQPGLALEERERFFDRYVRGGDWQTEMAKRDSGLVPRVDSMALAIGLYVGDSYFRKAESSKDIDTYKTAAKSYQRTVKKYPDNPLAASARWNLAVILDTRLDEKQAAYKHYLEYSRTVSAPDSTREQAALNAIAIAQGLLSGDTSAQTGTIEMTAVKLIEAVDNYVKLFPQGASRTNVLLAEGSVFFNRKMFGNAAKIYEDILMADSTSKEHFEAAFLLGQCHFGEENWTAAAQRFDYVWKQSSDAGQQEQAYKLLLQSRFLYAKGLAEKGHYEKAAAAFLGVEESYPGSEYSDIVMFNAAEAYEKMESWKSAADVYLALVRKYPASKLAPDALYNAAAVLEKLNEFARVAEVYEMLVSQYPKSDKAKDALFNLGFCYEKLGKLEKMAEANERYSLAYPGEKDVEMMLLRSGKYYVKAEMHEKALNVYRNFGRRFPNSAGNVEALFMTGQSYEQQKDLRNARLQYEAAESANMKLVSAGAVPNNYYAGEAAYRLATLAREQMLEIKLVQPERVLKERQKQKTELLAEAAKGYERVIKYQSKRMFEAAYMIGRLYDDLATAWMDQERPKLDPIKAAVYEKDLASAAAALIQKAAVPFRKTIEIAAQFDSLGAEQKKWLAQARNELAANYVRAGDYMVDAVSAMQNAPVPKAIKEKILHLFQYKKQLLETVEPMKRQIREYYLNSVSQLKQEGLVGEESQKCLEQFAEMNFRIGGGYDSLAQELLKNTQDLPANMDDVKKEDLLFQMEDIIFELQDKSIFAYEESRQLAIDNNLKNNVWYHRIMEGLARLSPETYGKSFYEQVAYESGADWIVRSDSVAGWVSATPPRDGWTGVLETGKKGTGFPVGYAPRFITHVDSSMTHYYWYHVLVKGEPRDGSVYVMSSDPYRLYVNSLLTLSDTLPTQGKISVDSAVGIVSLLKPGDNILGVETRVDSVGGGRDGGIAVLVTVLTDSTGHYESSVTIPKVKRPKPLTMVEAPAEQLTTDSLDNKGAPSRSSSSAAEYASQYKNRGEFLAAIEGFVQKEKNTRQDIRRERMECQKLQIMKNALDVQINMVQQEIEKLKTDLNEMGREK